MDRPHRYTAILLMRKYTYHPPSQKRTFTVYSISKAEQKTTDFCWHFQKYKIVKNSIFKKLTVG
jgi:hypothetical protein